MHLQPTSRVSDVVRELPHAPRVLSEFQEDYCCGGDATLGEFCRRERLDFRELARALEDTASEGSVAVRRGTFDPARASATELVSRLLDRHHPDARQSMRSIARLLHVVLGAHRAEFPDLERVASHFAAIVREFEAHMKQEESDAFPAIVDADRGHVEGRRLDHALRILRLENELVGEMLDLLRMAAKGYQPPPGACPTMLALYRELAAFDHALVEHVALEDEQLVPRAEALAVGS